MEQVDDIKYWREKANDYEALYRKQKEVTRVYIEAFHDLMAYDDDKRMEAKEKIRELESDLL